MARVEIKAVLSLVVVALLICIAGCAKGDATSGGPTPTPTPQPGPHSVEVAWDPSPSPNVQGYKVYRSQVSGGQYTNISGTLPTSPQQFKDANVVAGQDYFYVITSIDSSGLESAPSPEVSAKVPTP